MKLFFIIQLFLMLALSSVSGYHWPDWAKTNWSIVLFLTPVGMIQNFLDSQSILRTFYNDPSSGQLSLSLTQKAAMTAIYLILVFNARVALRVYRRRK